MSLLKSFLEPLKVLFANTNKRARNKSKSTPKKKASPPKRASKKASKKKKVKVQPKKISKSKPVPKAARLKEIPKPKREAVLKPKGVLAGEITHFFSRIQVVVIKMNKGELSVGDRIRIQGNQRDFVQTVKSLQIDNQDVPTVRKGQEVGLKVIQAAKEGDLVYKI